MELGNLMNFPDICKVLLFQESCNDNIVTQYVRTWLKLPEFLREALIKTGWKFVLYDGEISSLQKAGAVRPFGGDDIFPAAVTKLKDKTIIIGRSNGKDTIERIFSHEIGHALDRMLIGASTTQGFIKSLEMDKDAFVSTFSCHQENIKDNAELYAEVFSRFLLNRQELNNTCPTLYFYFAAEMKYVQSLLADEVDLDW